MRKLAFVILAVFGVVSVSFGDGWDDISSYKHYKELKAWIEDMKVKYPHLKADNPETIEKYGEYPRLQPFINDLEFIDDFVVEVNKE